MSLDFVEAFQVGRDAYVTADLAFRAGLDRTDAKFHLQVARIGSQVWLDVCTVDAAGLLTLPSYTVANLPFGPTGARALATDLTAPSYLAPAVGGGTVVAPVFFNGAQWITG